MGKLVQTEMFEYEPSRMEFYRMREAEIAEEKSTISGPEIANGNLVIRGNPQDVLISLPDTAEGRKDTPIMSGVLDYFPAAIAVIAQVSKAGNDQHNPGQPLHWSRGKSTDHADCVVRHLIQRGTRDVDGLRHSAKAAWRALALLQEEIEAEAGFTPGGA